MILINCYKITVLIARFGVGQNLYIYKQTLKAPANDWTAAVTDWYDEVALFRNKDVQPFAFSTATGHYTQVVWADTEELGCGMVYYKGATYYETLIVCNYAKGGNFQGTFAYCYYHLA